MRAGDYVLVASYSGKGGPKGHLVRAIVPPNKKTHVVGWVELSSDPIPEADLVREKKRIVRPDVVRDRIEFAATPGDAWRRLSGFGYKPKYLVGRICAIDASRFGPPALNPQFGYWWEGSFKTGDVVAVLGGAFLATCEEKTAHFDRISEKELPAGVKEPEWDSVTLPIAGKAGMQRLVGERVQQVTRIVEFQALKISGADPKDARAEFQITVLHPAEEKMTASVKAGEYLLVGEKGYLVRAVIAPNKETHVVGWLEISPHPIPEADLLRDKKSIVRPKFEKDKK